MSFRYWKGAHTKHRIRTHLVFIPKYRRRVIKGKVAIRIKNLFYQACHVNKWWIDALGIESDHVHMVIQHKARESVADVVKILKGGSSRKIRLEFPELEEFLWGDSFWSDGYFAESVGVVNEEVVKNYIEKHNEKSIEGD